MKSSSPIRSSSGRWLIVLVAVIALLAAACGSSSDTDAEPELPSIDEPDDSTEATDDESGNEAEVAETQEAVDPEQAFAEFEACMADHGVSVSIGGQGGAAVDDLEPGSDPAQNATPEDFEAAQAECDPILDSAFGSFDLSPEQEAEQADAMLELEQCLAEAGFEIDTSGGSFQIPQDVDFDEFNLAMNDCAPAGAIDGGS
ncbi:MAG: hypothetical protein ACKVG5_13450 [Acidimicrobiales bacterium]